MNPISWLRRLFSTGVTDALSPSDAKHVRFTNFVALLGIVGPLSWVPVQLATGHGWTAIPNIASAACAVAAIYLNRAFRHRGAALLVLGTLFPQVGLSVWMWGFESGILFTLAACIVMPFLMLPTADRHLATGFSLFAATMLVGGVAGQDQLPAQVLLLPAKTEQLLNAMFSALSLVGMAVFFSSSVTEAEQALAREKERSERLLRNVLPETIANRLKADPQRAIADKHQEVTVLFADIVGFTPLSERLSPSDTVELLNQVFTAFDEICARHGVEKIRTIGDGYMVAAGAPEHREDHAFALTRVALEMRDYMASHPTGEQLAVRIGLNSGPVVAGIVGTTRFHYDVWGDSVNVAARMESLGEPGRIHVAEGTWRHIRDGFRCESRGRIPVKGKGELETWFVEGPQTA